jgi:hypothetical protein
MSRLSQPTFNKLLYSHNMQQQQQFNTCAIEASCSNNNTPHSHQFNYLSNILFITVLLKHFRHPPLMARFQVSGPYKITFYMAHFNPL